jgi:hypothetical protein
MPLHLFITFLVHLPVIKYFSLVIKRNNGLLYRQTFAYLINYIFRFFHIRMIFFLQKHSTKRDKKLFYYLNFFSNFNRDNHLLKLFKVNFHYIELDALLNPTICNCEVNCFQLLGFRRD